MVGPLLDLANRGVENSLGISPIDLGAQDDLRRISGKVVQAAQLASNVIVAVLFDSMRKFRRAYGLTNVRFLRHMYDPAELIKIVGDEKAQDVPLDSEAWNDILLYDIAIDEQPASPTELMETLGFLTQTDLLGKWLDRGWIQFEDALDLIPAIPASKKRDIIKNNTVMEQKLQSDQATKQAMMLVQELYQVVSALPGGQDALQGLLQEQQVNQFSQQVFSQPGVPQALPNQ